MNKKWKTIGLTALGAAVVIGGASLIVNAVNTDENLKTIHPTFAIGDLDENGEYVESDQALYTKNAFEFTNLEITLDFENDIEFAVHYYDENGDFLGATENKNKKYSYENDDEKITDATHARVVIYPQWSNIEDEEDMKVTYFNKLSFSSQLTIKVFDGERSNLRQFTIIYEEVKSKTYTYEIGMTWNDFVESEYNLDGIFDTFEDHVKYDGCTVVLDSTDGDTVYVDPLDIIDDRLTYVQSI